ncbi:hypothetical protein V6Z11_A10G119000 [Gossypium hirsutum]
MPSLIRRVSLPPSINQENQKPKTFHSELFHCQNNSRTFNISMSNPSFYHPFPLPLLLIQMLVLPGRRLRLLPVSTRTSTLPELPANKPSPQPRMRLESAC